MELDLSPKFSRSLFEGDGGSYSAWSSSDLPLLKEAKVGAGKLVLKPLGFALPHYADSAKIGYVLQGKGMAGIMVPQERPKEKIVRLEKGDAIQVPLGVVSWWYNDGGESELVIIFLGDTSQALVPGQFTYFLLAGSAGIFNGFSTEFMSRSFGALEEKQVKQIFGSQPGFLLIKLQERLRGLEPCQGNEEDIMKRTDNDLFCAETVQLGSDEIWKPRYLSEPAVQVIFVMRGSGKFQIVGSGGQRVLDAEVQEGGLFVVPRFSVISAIAGGQGMEWFSITASPLHVYGRLTGKGSVLQALSLQILAASLNVDQDVAKMLSSMV